MLPSLSSFKFGTTFLTSWLASALTSILQISSSVRGTGSSYFISRRCNPAEAH